MVIYFSATGNCRFAAQEIAAATGEAAVSVTEVCNKLRLKDGENLGIVVPTYFWGLPAYMEEFFKRVCIENAEKSYIYYVATYGSTCGQADYFAKKHLKRKGLALSASYGIKTVDNWTVWYSVENAEKIQQTLKYEKEQIEKIIEGVKSKSKEFISKDKKALWLCMGAKYSYNLSRRTKHLNVNDKCVSCGLCQDNCPEKAIKIVDGKPEWVTKRCSICLKCLHNCPEFAINYDNKTQNNGQYKRPEKI